MTTYSPRVTSSLAVGLFAAVVIGWMATPYMGLATASYAILATGIFAAPRGSRLHASLMTVGVAADLLQVLWIEFSRGAIAETLRQELPLLPLLHVVTSASAVLCYAPALYFGKQAFGTPSSNRTRKIHRNWGIAAFALRTVGYLLMFSLLSFFAQRQPNL